jgi:hypothetical protein
MQECRLAVRLWLFGAVPGIMADETNIILGSPKISSVLRNLTCSFVALLQELADRKKLDNILNSILTTPFMS